MRSAIIFTALILSSSLQAAPQPSSNTGTIQMQSQPAFTPNFGFELQIGGQKPLNGPDDARATKVTLSFLKYFDRWSVVPQFSFLRSSSAGEGIVAVETRSTEYMAWGRYDFLRTRKIAIHGGLGFGGRTDTVDTNFMGKSYSATSEMYGLGALSSGIAFTPGRPRFSFEIQYSVVPSYDIQEFSFLLGGGVLF